MPNKILKNYKKKKSKEKQVVYCLLFLNFTLKGYLKIAGFFCGSDVYKGHISDECSIS